MPHQEIAFQRIIEDDPTPLDEVVRRGAPRPLLLWGHPEIGRSVLVEEASRAAGIPFHRLDAEQFESWDGFRDISESGHFREFSLEKFLAKGERADPNTFTVAAGEVLFLRGLNHIPTRLVQAVFEQLLEERMLLNNPLPEDVRIVAAVDPTDRQMAIELLGPTLRDVWNVLDDRSPLKYTTFPLPKRVLQACDHWAVVPSVRRFVAWGRRKGLAEEMLRFLESEPDPKQTLVTLHASLLKKAEMFAQVASPRSFADLGSLLVERRPYFSSRALKDALASSTNAEDFKRWLHGYIVSWDPDRWSEADGSLTLRGESVPGSVWLRNLVDQVKRGEVVVGLEDLPTYSAYERRSLEAWATQELGDDLGRRFVRQLVVTEAELRHLGKNG